MVRHFKGQGAYKEARKAFEAEPGAPILRCVVPVTHYAVFHVSDVQKDYLI